MAAVDTSGNIGYWKNKLDAVIRGDEDPVLPTGRLEALQMTRTKVLEELPVTVPETERHAMDGVSEAIGAQRSQVKDAFSRRRDAGKPCEPNGMGTVCHATSFDDSKLLRMEADMTKRFADKVAMPAKLIRPSRQSELQTAETDSFCRGNELFEKRDFVGAIAEFSVAMEVPQLRFFALVNRGNAYKAAGLAAEAIASYQDALDEAPDALSSEGKLLHSFVLNNLGAACQDDARLDQALHNFTSAFELNEQCTLAIKNRANLHLARAEQLQREDAPALVPPQHELAYGLYIKSMEQDWQLPVIFPVQHGVLIRLEFCVTSQNDDPRLKLGRNISYHFTSNLTHASSVHV